MKTIYKYEIRPDKLIIEMPSNARILHTDEQYGKICIWAEVETENPTEIRHFEVYGTGHPMYELQKNESRIYIGTVKLEGGALIFHVYEYKETK